MSTLCQSGVAHLIAERLDEAEQDFRSVVGLQPSHLQGLFALGVITWRQQRNELALDYACRLVALAPEVAAHHLLLARIQRELHRLAEAAASFRAALCQVPDDDVVWCELASVLSEAGQPDDAATCYRTALRLQPTSAPAYYNLGVLLFGAKQFAEAATAFRTVLDLRPDHPDAPNKLGATLLEMGECESAASYLALAVERQPTRPAPHSNLGVALRELGQVEAAEACFVRALDLDQDFAKARYNLATTMLQTGRLSEGWRLFESRWQTALRPRAFEQPRWAGEDLGTQVLLLHAEQGMGDTLQFCRYVTAAAQRARVVLEVQPPLARLLGQSFAGVAAVIARGDAIPSFDRHCPLMSLPLVFGTTLETIPGETPYLIPNHADINRWRHRLDGLPGLRVGLVWRGNPDFALTGEKRDLDPAHLAGLSSVPDVSFVSLQKDLSPDDRSRAACYLEMTDWTDELRDFADTAALVAGLDLVIGVDTAVVHLAGSLGRPVWLLNRSDPCWRWLRDRDDSPWYPSLRQFRQRTMRDWPGVMDAVRGALLTRGLSGRSLVSSYTA